jgi:hypothetical protein
MGIRSVRQAFGLSLSSMLTLFERIDKLNFVGQFRMHEMKTLTEVVASLLLALVALRASGSLFGIIYEWKLRAGKF